MTGAMQRMDCSIQRMNWTPKGRCRSIFLVFTSLLTVYNVVIIILPNPV